MRIRTIRVWHGATEKWPLSEGHRPHFRGVRVALGTGYSRPGNEDGARVSSARHAPTRVQSLSVAVCVCGWGGAWYGVCWQRSNRDDQSSVRSLGGFDITSMKSVRVLVVASRQVDARGVRPLRNHATTHTREGKGAGMGNGAQPGGRTHLFAGLFSHEERCPSSTHAQPGTPPVGCHHRLPRGRPTERPRPSPTLPALQSTTTDWGKFSNATAYSSQQHGYAGARLLRRVSSRLPRVASRARPPMASRRLPSRCSHRTQVHLRPPGASPPPCPRTAPVRSPRTAEAAAMHTGVRRAASPRRRSRAGRRRRCSA
jgi:hypothetical protein